MAERRTRQSFTREFKAQAVKRLLDGGQGLTEVAPELGTGTGQLSQRRTEHLASGSAEALAVRKAEQAETQRLKRAAKRLEEEVEILRKAAAFPPRGFSRKADERDEVQLRVGRTGEPRRGHAVPGGRRERERLLRPTPGCAIPAVRSRAKVEAELRGRIEPDLRRPSAGLRLDVFYNRQLLHSAIGYRTPAEARASMEGIAMRAAAGCSDLTSPGANFWDISADRFCHRGMVTGAFGGSGPQ